MEVIHLLGKAFGRHARKGFDVANKMRLVKKVEGTRHICQSFKFSGFDQAHRFIKPLHPYIHMWGKAHSLDEAPSNWRSEICRESSKSLTRREPMLLWIKWRLAPTNISLGF